METRMGEVAAVVDSHNSRIETISILNPTGNTVHDFFYVDFCIYFIKKRHQGESSWTCFWNLSICGRFIKPKIHFGC